MSYYNERSDLQRSLHLDDGDGDDVVVVAVAVVDSPVELSHLPLLHPQYSKEHSQNRDCHLDLIAGS